MSDVADTVGAEASPVVFEHLVATRWADGDPFGHVNHAVFITYLEEARDRWFEATLGSERVYVLVRIEIDLKQELFPSTRGVTVRIAVEELGRSKMVTREEVVGPEGTVIASARVITVRWDEHARKPVHLTESEREALRTPVPIQ
jgi:acyl-CoA thioester hydrolase